MSKGSGRRPCKTSREEHDLRWALALKQVTFAEFEQKYKALKRKGLIYRR